MCHTGLLMRKKSHKEVVNCSVISKSKKKNSELGYIEKFLTLVTGQIRADKYRLGIGKQHERYKLYYHERYKRHYMCLHVVDIQMRKYKKKREKLSQLQVGLRVRVIANVLNLA
jgi:hypothetical protein